MPDRGRPKLLEDTDLEEVAKLRDAGFTMSDIGDKLGVSANCVYRLLERNGMSKSRGFGTTFPQETFDRIDRISKVFGISKPEFVRIAVERMLKELRQ